MVQAKGLRHPNYQFLLHNLGIPILSDSLCIQVSLYSSGSSIILILCWIPFLYILGCSFLCLKAMLENLHFLSFPPFLPPSVHSSSQPLDFCLFSPPSDLRKGEEGGEGHLTVLPCPAQSYSASAFLTFTAKYYT